MVHDIEETKVKKAEALLGQMDRRSTHSIIGSIAVQLEQLWQREGAIYTVSSLSARELVGNAQVGTNCTKCVKASCW